MIILSLTILVLAGCGAQTTQETSSPHGEAFFSADTVVVKAPEGMTEEDVSKHDSADSCYTIINGLVYDITDYIEFSPSETGMSNDKFRARLADSCGNDGTLLFREIYGENHYRLDSYLIGAIV